MYDGRSTSMYIVEELGCICGSGKSGKRGKRGKKGGEGGQKYRQIVIIQIILIIVDKLVSIVDAKEIRQKCKTKKETNPLFSSTYTCPKKKIHRCHCDCKHGEYRAWNIKTKSLTKKKKYDRKYHGKPKDEYLQLAMPGMGLTARDAAQDTGLAQEPEGSNKAENRQTGSRPQNSGEVFGGADGRSVLCMLVDATA